MRRGLQWRVLLSERQWLRHKGELYAQLTEEWDEGKEGSQSLAHIKSNPGCDDGLVAILFLISLSVRDA